MLFHVVSNKHQETQLRELERLHEASFESSDNFSELLVKFVQKHRDKDRPYYIDKISDAVRHIIYSFKEYEAEPDDYKNMVERDYTMMLSFFFNANAFIHIIKDCELKDKVLIDNSLFYSIKFFRDCFAHQYEKELIKGGDKYYIPYIKQRAMAMLDILEICDPKSGKNVYEVNFSLRYFYVSLKNIFEKLV